MTRSDAWPHGLQSGISHQQPGGVHGGVLEHRSDREEQELGCGALQLHGPIHDAAEEDDGRRAEGPLGKHLGEVVGGQAVRVGGALAVDDEALVGERGDDLRGSGNG